MVQILEKMKDRIRRQLNEMAERRQIEILFAAESGSRAWGFASPDSDYDVRFVYRQKTESYLRLWSAKDSIQLMTPDLLDVAGWDIKKATILLAKSNASLLGWLFSPIVYLEKGNTLSEMQQLVRENFNPVAVFHHYHSMNKAFYDQLDTNSMNLKSFFYAIRTALCANWVLHFKSVPPVEFRKLYELINPENARLLDQLIARKASVPEAGMEHVHPQLMKLIRDIVAENKEKQSSIIPTKVNYEAFDRFFLNTLS